MITNIKNRIRNVKYLNTILYFLHKLYVINIVYKIRAYRNFSNLKEYYSNNSNEKIIEAIQELKKNKKLMIPFRYIKKYDKLAFDVIDSEYPSLKINNNIVYFPTNTNRRDILGAVKTHFIEQDVESPHKYFIDKTEIQGHTAILVGASDGLLALDIIDSFKHIFLIESDNNWIEPLRKTFAPYKEKITIINTYASDLTTDKEKKLDDLFANYEYSIDFLQADVEGAAIKLLKGTEIILNRYRPKLAIACYHSHDEAMEIEDLIKILNYKISYSQKFVYLWMQDLKPPYLRKGVLYAAN
jgi:hypothetical protein